MDNGDLITVIVPVYNTEKYLKECLDSLVKQSYRNLEIILINDGSTDNSSDICRFYCKKYGHFQLIEQENKGLGMARNAGLDRARGRYICFVDSDDYVHERFVELLYENVIEYQADISVCNYRQFEGDNPSEMIVSNTTCLWSKEQMLSDLSTVGPQNRSVPVVICCNKLIKAELFRGLRFVDKYHEDEYIVNDYIARMGKAVWSDAILYYYRRHTNSITGSERKKDLRHLDVLKAIENRIEIFSGDEYSAVFNKILCSYFENAAVCYFGLKDGKNTRKLVLAIYPQYFKIFLRYMRKLNRRQRLHYALFLLSPSWYRRRYWE